MRSYIVRHWAGTLNAWLSLLNVVLVYFASTTIVALYGGPIRGNPQTILFMGVWIVLNVVAVFGMLRSVFRALKYWRDHKLEAVGAIVAIGMIGVAAYFVYKDLEMLVS